MGRDRKPDKKPLDDTAEKLRMAAAWIEAHGHDRQRTGSYGQTSITFTWNAGRCTEVRMDESNVVRQILDEIH